MRIKLFFLFVIIFLFPEMDFSQRDLKEKIILKITPDSLIQFTTIDYIDIQIENVCKDTLLSVIDPFLLEGIGYTQCYYLGPISSYFRPNEIYFEPKGFERYEGRGEKNLRFQNLPKILLIRPYSFLLIRVIIDKESKKILYPLNWNLCGCVWYKEKNIIDSALSLKYPDLINEYNSSLINQDTIDVLGINSIPEKFRRNDDLSFEKLSAMDSVMKLFNNSSCICKKK